MLQMRQCGLNLSLRSMFSSSRAAAMSSCEAQPGGSGHVVCVQSGSPAELVLGFHQIDAKRCSVFFSSVSQDPFFSFVLMFTVLRLTVPCKSAGKHPWHVCWTCVADEERTPSHTTDMICCG